MEKIKKILTEMGLPFEYHHFEEYNAVAPPFIVYFIDKANSLYADGNNYFNRKEVIIELYTDNKDSALEEKLEKIINKNGLAYDHEEGYIQSENMYLVRYEMEVI